MILWALRIKGICLLLLRSTFKKREQESKDAVIVDYVGIQSRGPQTCFRRFPGPQELKLLILLGVVVEKEGKQQSAFGGPQRKWQPTPLFLPGEFQGQKSLAGYCSQGHKESETNETERQIENGSFRSSKFIDNRKPSIVTFSSVQSLSRVQLFATP